MIEFIDNFHFLRPIYLTALIIPILFAILYKKKNSSNSNWQEVCDKRILDFLVIKHKYKAKNTINLLIILAYVLSILAIAGPVWKKIELPNMVKNDANMIILDMSSDMKKKDISPNRLERAKFELYDLLDNSKSTQFGLIVYSSEPFLITPITQDKNLVKNLIKNIDFSIMPKDGKRLDRAIELAIEKLKSSKIDSSEITIMASDIGNKINLVFNEGKRAKMANAKLNVIALDKQKSDSLEALANLSSGEFYRIDNLKSLYKTEDIQIEGELKKDESKSQIWLDYGYMIVPFIMFVVALLFRKSVLIIILFLSFPNLANAGFFTNSNQDGLKTYNQGNYEAALNSFEDEKYQANSLYKLGKFEKAAEIYKNFNDDKSQYNLALSVAKAGKIKEAISLFEEYIKLHPSDDDARYNLELLKKIPPQSNQSNQDKKNDKNSDKDEKKNKDNKDQNFDKNKDDKDKKESDKKNKKQNQNNDEKNKDKGDKKNKETVKENLSLSEEEQAKEQIYREIKIDNSSLLRRFIKYEYMKDRYGERG